MIDQSQQLQAIAENKIKLLEQKETPPEPVNGSPSIESKKRLFSSIVWEIIMKIIKNRARCKNCGDIIESNYRNDIKSCRCGAITVDGGHDYIRRGFDKTRKLRESKHIALRYV